jgi:hypothetical protein
MVRDLTLEIVALERALLAMDRAAAVRVLTGEPLSAGMAVARGVDGAAPPPSRSRGSTTSSCPCSGPDVQRRTAAG